VRLCSQGRAEAVAQCGLQLAGRWQSLDKMSVWYGRVSRLQCSVVIAVCVLCVCVLCVCVCVCVAHDSLCAREVKGEAVCVCVCAFL
jgi:hypothetical protein